AGPQQLLRTGQIVERPLLLVRPIEIDAPIALPVLHLREHALGVPTQVVRVRAIAGVVRDDDRRGFDPITTTASGNLGVLIFEIPTPTHEPPRPRSPWSSDPPPPASSQSAAGPNTQTPPAISPGSPPS